MKPEVADAETEVQSRVQGRGGSARRDRGVSAAQAARDLDVHENVLRKTPDGEPMTAEQFRSLPVAEQQTE